MKNNLLAIGMGLSLITGCQPKASRSHLNEAWNAANNPVVMMAVKNEFETDFTKLPTSGRPSKMPWSDHYWPTYHGGISYRWGDAKSKKLDKMVRQSSDEQFAGQLDDNEALQKLRSEVLGYATYSKDQLAAMDKEQRASLIATLSPAEKIDIYRGAFDYPTVKSERDRTAILATLRTLPSAQGDVFEPNPKYEKGKKIPTWFGICHAWAPATILFDEPGPLTLESKDGFEVRMAGSDIKALLSHIIDADSSQQRTDSFMAERCNNDLSSSAEEELIAIFNGLEAGSLVSIDKQVNALIELSKFDYPTNLAIASHFYSFAPSQEEAKLGFQKLFERLQNRLSAGSSLRKKLGLAYIDSLKNFASAGKPEDLDREKIKAAVVKAINIPACNDTNAGAFHLVLTNLMGLQQKSFGIDVTRDSEVWNQAAASYSSRVLKTYIDKDISDEAAPGTVKELLIETEFLYTTEEMPAWNRFGDNKSLQRHHVPAGDVYQNGNRRYKALRYRIELDKGNHIIGGSWVSDVRPDFLWGTGNFIFDKEFSDIEDIYYQSI
jgi:hypothetical protein